MSWSKPEEAERWQRELGYRLRDLREQREMSQMALAHAAQLDPTYVSSVERGRRNVGLVNIICLANALGVAPSVLLEGVGTQRGRARRR